MLTSRRPDTLRLYDFYSYWRRDRPNYRTLPQHLKAAGYTTRSFGKIFHPGASSNHTDDYPHSWSVPAFHSITETEMNRAVCPDPQTGALERNLVCPVDLPQQPYGMLPDQDTVLRAIEFMRIHALDPRAPRQPPYFVAVGLHKPHIPLRFPRAYLQRHEPVERFAAPPFAYVPHALPAVAFAPFTDIRRRSDVQRQNVSFPFGPMPAAFGQRVRQAYYAAVSYVDDLVGELMRAVDWRETVVVLTSDHGWSLGEHAEWAKYSNFEVALRVPLIVCAAHLKGPRREEAAPTHVPRVVELLDVYPTIIELAGLKVPRRCERNGNAENDTSCTEGRSLVPFMLKHVQQNGTTTEDEDEQTTAAWHTDEDHDDDDAAGTAFSQYPRPADYPQANSDRPRLAEIRLMGYSMRTTHFRYTAWLRFDAVRFRRDWSVVVAEELYDHRLDAAEDSNLVERAELQTVRWMLRRRLRRRFL